MTKRLIFLLLVFFALGVALRAADDPSLGAWKLNISKSKYSPGPLPQGETNQVRPYGDNGIAVTAEITDATGKKINVAYSGSFDGKDFPVTGDGDADTSSMRRIDALTIERTKKKAGKITTVMTYSVSKDGKTKTVHTKGTSAKGQPIDNFAVFEKQ